MMNFITSRFFLPVVVGQRLGVTYYWKFEEAFQGWYTTTSDMVYFKKGSEIWGNPVAADCNVLLATNDKNNESMVGVTFFPNPVGQSAVIQIKGIDNLRGLLMGIYDMLGRNVMTIPIAEGHTTFIRGGLPSGLYLYILRSDQGLPLSTGRVIFE